MKKLSVHMKLLMLENQKRQVLNPLFFFSEYSMFLTPCHSNDLFRTDCDEVSGVKAVLHCKFVQSIALFSVTYYISEDSA